MIYFFEQFRLQRKMLYTVKELKADLINNWDYFYPEAGEMKEEPRGDCLNYVNL